MTEDYFEIKDSDVSMVCIEGTPKTCKIQVSAEPLDAVCICGAMIGSCIETYFRLVNEADLPKDIALTAMTNTLVEAFESVGYTEDIDVTKNND